MLRFKSRNIERSPCKWKDYSRDERWSSQIWQVCYSKEHWSCLRATYDFFTSTVRDVLWQKLMASWLRKLTSVQSESKVGKESFQTGINNFSKPWQPIWLAVGRWGVDGQVKDSWSRFWHRFRLARRWRIDLQQLRWWQIWHTASSWFRLGAKTWHQF